MKPASAATALRVLHVGKFFPPDTGGMEVFLADLVRAQRAGGDEVFALVHGDPRDDDPPWLRRVPVRAKLVFAPIAPGFPAALARAIRDFRPDVLHLHLPNLSALWVLALPSARALPWLVHWHADVVPSRLRGKLALAYRFYRPFEQALLGRADRIVATSPDYLAASPPLAPWTDKCAVVPLGIDRERLPPPPAPPVSAGDEPLRIVTIGRLTYYKGFETLIDAVAGLPSAQLDIVGEGEERRSLEARIAAHGPDAAARIRLRGALDDAEKFALLARADLFAMASRERTEAFGVAVLEAMSQARPCLVTALAGSGMPWLVRSAGCGRLAALDDVADWQRAITAYAADQACRRREGAAGLAALGARFDIHRVAARLRSAYPVERTYPPGHRQRILIVIPARDEAASIGDLLGRLHASGWHDVLVVDDHSRDGTAAIARAAGAVVLQPALPLGAWGAMQTGIRYALRHGFTGVITMDADGQHEVSELPTLLRARDQADVVIGACPERGSRLRHIAWAWFRRIAGFSLADLTSGFRYYDRHALEVLAEDEATLLDYQDVGVLLLLRKSGMRITEVPVAMNLRQAGKSRIFHSWLAVGSYMAQTTLLCLARWHRSKSHGSA